MKILFFSIVFFALSSSSKAQFVERIYLKDSTTSFTGWVVEQVPQEYLKILRQKERDTVTISAASIWKIVRVIDAKANNPFSLEQEIGRNQSIFFELLGSGFFYSLNYDTRFVRNKRNGLGIRVGVGYLDLDVTDQTNSIVGFVYLTSIPIQVNYLVGKKRSALELGAGVTSLIGRIYLNTVSNSSYIPYFDQPISAFYVAPTATIGYRFTSLKNGFMFRASVNPALAYGDFIVGAGVSIGYHFARKKAIRKSVELMQK